MYRTEKITKDTIASMGVLVHIKLPIFLTVSVFVIIVILFGGFISDLWLLTSFLTVSVFAIIVILFGGFVSDLWHQLTGND